MTKKIWYEVTISVGIAPHTKEVLAYSNLSDKFEAVEMAKELAEKRTETISVIEQRFRQTKHFDVYDYSFIWNSEVGFVERRNENDY